MFDSLHFFRTPTHSVALALPFALEEVIEAWSRLRFPMAKTCPDAFSRDEWAYLTGFLDREHLWQIVQEAIGLPEEQPSGTVRLLLRPRGRVAVWLPNNVTLLGPLLLVLLSLTGNKVRLKVGTHCADLAGTLLRFALEHQEDDALESILRDRVQIESFGHEDPRQQEMAAGAQVRIVFGSNETAEAIQALPNPLESNGFSFVDRQSEAWADEKSLTDAVLSDLIKVFSIYGQAGCTAPRRLVVLGASMEGALELRDRLSALWPQVLPKRPPVHLASANVLGCQWAAAMGWQATLVEGNQTVLALGTLDLPEVHSPMTLMICPATLEEAIRRLPPQIQTIGYAFQDTGDPQWLAVVARSGIKRWVPLARMHHFGAVWDGHSFWRQTFEAVEIGP
ncbi:MAG TPA: hypothetical protein DCE18_15455 [Syntrophobacteraceae bacterium]|nr:hypothetical protein [Syntrophobacteraceae bacterium]